MANKDTNSNKTPAKMDWEKAKKLLYQAEADILVNKPIPHYNKLSNNFDMSELVPLILFSSTVGVVSAIVYFSEPQGVFSTIVMLASMGGFMTGGIGVLAHLISNYKSSLARKDNKLFNFFISTKKLKELQDNRKAYTEYLKQKEVHQAYINHKREELTRMGVFETLNGKNNTKNAYFTISHSGRVEVLNHHAARSKDSTLEIESQRAEAMLREILADREKREREQETGNYPDSTISEDTPSLS